MATRTKKPARARPTKKRSGGRSFWPCKLVEQATGFSIVLADDLYLLGHRLGDRDAGGYAVERLVKVLARAQDPALLRRVKFDSEAGMFCAYGEDLDALHAIATLLAGAT